MFHQLLTPIAGSLVLSFIVGALPIIVVLAPTRSGKTLARLFLSETGMTFGRWRQQARLVASLPRLASGDAVILSVRYSDFNALHSRRHTCQSENERKKFAHQNIFVRSR